MQNNISFILQCSRAFALPTTIFSWLVIFIYSLTDSGNLFYGLISLLGLCFAHLGTNLIDDYFDYKSLIKLVNFDKAEYLRHSQKTKCRYLISGQMKESQVIILAGMYFLLAILVGIFLFLKCGEGVLIFASIGAFIAILYPFLSKVCLSELAVAIAYGPALYGGVYYVMTGTYSNNIYILSIPTMLMTIILLYIHTVMDYRFDLDENKCTIANRFNSELDSLIVLKFLFVLGYLSLIMLCIFDILDWQVFLIYLTIPMSIDLYKSLELYACNPKELPVHKWYHFPMENLNKLKARGEDSFMIRIYQARNLMMYFSIVFALAIILSLGL